MKKSDSITLVEIIFYVGLTLEVLIMLIDKSALINPIEGQFFRMTFLLFGVKILCTKYSLKEWLMIGFFLGIGILSYFSIKDNNVIRVVVFIAACKNIDVKPMLKYVFYVTLIGILVLIILALTGTMGVLSVTGDFGRGSVETRYCFGLGHPNALHCMVWALITLYLFLYFDKCNITYFVILLVGNYLIFLLTLSKTGLLMTSITVLIYMAFKYIVRLQESKWVYMVCEVIICICVIFSLAISTVGHDFVDGKYPILHKIDLKLTGRIYSMSRVTDFTKFSLFSRPENLESFDMGWIRLFAWYGFIPALLYIGILCLIVYRTYKLKDCKALAVILVFSLYTVLEAHAISVYLARNYVLFLMGTMWTGLFFKNGQREEYAWKSYRLLLIGR